MSPGWSTTGGWERRARTTSWLTRADVRFRSWTGGSGARRRCQSSIQTAGERAGSLVVRLSSRFPARYTRRSRIPGRTPLSDRTPRKGSLSQGRWRARTGFRSAGTGSGDFELSVSSWPDNPLASGPTTVTGSLTRGSSHKYEVTYGSSGTSVRPVADFSPEPKPGLNRTMKAGVLSTFDGSQSFDVDGRIVSYEWDFGDGANASEITAVHAFSRPGCSSSPLR